MPVIKAFIRCIIFFIPLLLITPVAAQDMGPFPEGKGRDALMTACTQCHGLDRLTRVSLDAAGWENALYDMMARGAVVDIKDLPSVRDYLVSNFAVDRRWILNDSNTGTR